MPKVLTGFPTKIPNLINEARHLNVTMGNFKGSSPELTTALAALPGAIDLLQTSHEEAKSRDSGTDADPSVPENYKLFGIFARCTNIPIPNLTAGQKYSITGQCVGFNGMGVMSAPCTLMSL
jgi:hypothetical protein